MQIFQNNQSLVESTNRQFGTGSTLTHGNYWVELVHGSVCDIYICYTTYEPPDDILTKFRTTPVTCTVVGKQDRG